MRAAFTKPVFDREKCIAIIPSRIADTKTAHIFYGSAVLTLIIFVPSLFEIKNYFVVLIGSAVVFLFCFLATFLLRNHERRNPALMIDNVGIIFQGIFRRKFVKWNEVSRITQGYSSFYLHVAAIGIAFKITTKNQKFDIFFLPVMRWKGRDHLFYILNELSVTHDFDLSITEPAIWHDADG